MESINLCICFEERENGEEDIEAKDSDDSFSSRESAESFGLKNV